MKYILEKEKLDQIEEILIKDLMDLGVHCVVLIDLSGNILIDLDSGEYHHDLSSLAALAAGNFGAVNAMAKLIGEDEFSLLFHKGKKESIHFSKVMDDFLLITIFGQDVSLGFLRLRVAEVINKLSAIFKL